MQNEFKAKLVNIRTTFGEYGIVAAVKVDGEKKNIGLIGTEDETNRLEIGSTYRFGGRRQTHEKYGDQISFDSYVLSSPAGRVGVTKYLLQADGIGEVMADKLWGMYRDDAIRHIKDESRHEHISRQCGTSMAVLKDAQQKFTDLERCEGVMIDLLDLFDRAGIHKRAIKELIRDHGTKAAAWVAKNPFRLMRYTGVGFIKCDALYLREGGLRKRIRRHMYGVEYALRYESREGHVWHRWDDVEKSMSKKISVPRVRAGVELGLRTGRLATRVIGARAYIALAPQAAAEKAMANNVAARVEHGRAAWGDVHGIEALSDHQRAGLARATAGRFGLLVGGPGTGKTYCIARLLEGLPKDEMRTAVCAPTGKAAKRIGQALAENGIRMNPTTIHSLLGVMDVTEGEFIFKHGPGALLPHDYVIADETSMADNMLLSKLLCALKPTCHVLLVGDKGQLSPVSPGSPLRDLIGSPHVPTGELTEVRRNSGMIVACCDAIRLEEDPVYGKHINEELGENLVLIPCADESKQQAAIGDVFGVLHQDGFDVLRDVCVITPRNQGGLITRTKLNEDLQLYLNHTGTKTKGNPFMISDPVVCLRNQTVEAYEWDDDRDRWHATGKTRVANGEQGYVCDVQDRKTWARLEGGDAVRINLSKDAKPIDWSLAYAITGHKSQGSEWPVAIVVLDDSFGGRLVSSRNWVYTAVSRARRRCYMIGRRPVLLDMLRKDDTNTRRTDLVSEIDAAMRSVSV